MFGIFKKLFISKGRQEEIDFLARLIAVSIYTDYKIKQEELDAVKKIEEHEHLNKAEAEYLEERINELLELYAQQNWRFLNDKDEIFKTIVSGRMIQYAQYAIEIFKADKEISKEEGIVIDKLNTIIEALEFLKKYYEESIRRHGGKGR